MSVKESSITQWPRCAAWLKPDLDSIHVFHEYEIRRANLNPVLALRMLVYNAEFGKAWENEVRLRTILRRATEAGVHLIFISESPGREILGPHGDWVTAYSSDHHQKPDGLLVLVNRSFPLKVQCRKANTSNLFAHNTRPCLLRTMEANGTYPLQSFWTSWTGAGSFDYVICSVCGYGDIILTHLTASSKTIGSQRWNMVQALIRYGCPREPLAVVGDFNCSRMSRAMFDEQYRAERQHYVFASYDKFVLVSPDSYDAMVCRPWHTPRNTEYVQYVSLYDSKVNVEDYGRTLLSRIEGDIKEYIAKNGHLRSWLSNDDAHTPFVGTLLMPLKFGVPTSVEGSTQYTMLENLFAHNDIQRKRSHTKETVCAEGSPVIQSPDRSRSNSTKDSYATAAARACYQALGCSVGRK
jgi:hypothetical protein